MRHSVLKTKSMKLFVCSAMIGTALFAGTPLAYATGTPPPIPRTAVPPTSNSSGQAFSKRQGNTLSIIPT